MRTLLFCFLLKKLHFATQRPMLSRFIFCNFNIYNMVPISRGSFYEVIKTVGLSSLPLWKMKWELNQSSSLFVNYMYFIKVCFLRIILFFFSWLVSGRNSLNPAIWLVPGVGGNFRSCPLTERFHPASSLCDKIELPYSKKKINKLFTGFGLVRIVKNCDLGLENAARGHRPRAAFSRPQSQFFTIRTSQPVNNIYIWLRTGIE